MIRLAEEFFDTKNDPDQISVSPAVMNRLRKIHPATMTEKALKKGPVAWVLVIPTTRRLMQKFVAKEIGEKEILRRTRSGAEYDAIYLCSALVLPEYRGRGLATRLLTRAVRSIRRDHPISCLFFWGFSREGKILASSVARKSRLPLYERPAKQNSPPNRRRKSGVVPRRLLSSR